jgi:hypothetical protein
VIDVPELGFPTALTPVLDKWPAVAPPHEVVDAIRVARARGLTAGQEQARFATGLRTALAGPSGSVVITATAPEQIGQVVSLIGTLLGNTTYRASALLGGPASAVPTGGINRYEQAWHTDSTPWVMPNRWSVLGLLREDSALADASTCLLPWATLARAWRDDQWVRTALRNHGRSWRDRYPALPPLVAPILGTVPRWFRPALASLIDQPEHHDSACRAVDDALLRVVHYHRTTLRPGRVLVFDNHAVLHRGPAVHEPSTRALLRLKVDGIPE